MEESKSSITILESLKIDSLKSRWVARLLFLSILLLYSLSRLYPIGDPDFSRYAAWYERYLKAGSSGGISAGLPVITVGNVVYLGFEVILIYVFLFIALLYLGVYLADRARMPTAAGLVRYFKRLPALILFVLFLTLVFAIPTLSFRPFILLVLPPIFLAPSLILQEKASSVDALMASIRRTYGMKLPIFINILILSLIYFSLMFIFAGLVNPSMKAFFLVEGFLRAYFVLSFGRLLGVMYDASINKEVSEASKE